MEFGSVSGGSHAGHVGNHPTPPSSHSSEVLVDGAESRVASDHLSHASSSAKSAVSESKTRLEQEIHKSVNADAASSPREEAEKFLNESSKYAATAKLTSPEAASQAASDLHTMNRSLNKTIDATDRRLENAQAEVAQKPHTPGSAQLHKALSEKREELQSLKSKVNQVHDSLIDLLDSNVGPKPKKSVFKKPWMVALLTGSATVVTLALLSAMFQSNRKSSKLLVIRDRPPQLPPQQMPPIQILQQPQAPIAPPPPPRSHNQPIIVVLPNGLNGLPKNSQN